LDHLVGLLLRALIAQVTGAKPLQVHVVIESVMIASLVLAAGVVLDQPIGLVLRGAGVVGAGCFVTGLILIGLTGAAGRLLARFRRPR
ncbi:MAG: hypothetical protein QHC67_16395, partial [Sphingobium sp.]|uniref:hypothetical protein n=1 Tax=Sphingobium sp. TaxID=1912891 RepID=UPI0029B94EEC